MGISGAGQAGPPRSNLHAACFGCGAKARVWMMQGTLAAALITAGLAGGARAQPMPTEEFEAFSTGRTLHFTLDGQRFGAEHFLPGRRTLWRFDGGPCLDGVWHAEGDRICFVYTDDPAAQCWHFLRDGAHLRAVLVEDGQETDFALDFSHADDVPLNCPGPDVGA